MYPTQNEDLNNALKDFKSKTKQEKVSLVSELSMQLVKEETPEEKVDEILSKYQI